MAETKKAVPSKAEETNGEASMRIDPELVRELARLLTDNELTEIEVQDGDRRIKVARETTLAAPARSVAAAAAPALAAPAMPGKEDIAAPVEEVAGTTVKSPMVGTAYMSPEPSAHP